MSLLKRAEANSLVAEFIFTQTYQEILKLSPESLYHIIISRFYYGIYLKAKDKLIQKNKYYNADSEINHIGKGGVWEILSDYGKDPHDQLVINQGQELARTRNTYEYTALPCTKGIISKMKTKIKFIEEAIERI